jgi:ATP-binding protein involved in chromosome partitioning
LLEKIPIDLEIGKGGDSGVPLMLSAPDSEPGRIFQAVAEKIMDVMCDQKSTAR